MIQIDNCLHDDLLFPIKNQILSYGFPWYRSENTAYETSTHKELYVDNPSALLYNYGWGHIVYEYEKPTSDMYNILYYGLQRALEKTNLKLDKLIRIKIGLHTGIPKSIRHSPHVDYLYNHMTALLYVVDSDGDTVLYNTFYDYNDFYNSSDRATNLAKNERTTIDKYLKNFDESDIYKKISPKANRFIVFSGNQFHASTTPKKHKYRITINYNFTVK